MNLPDKTPNDFRQPGNFFNAMVVQQARTLAPKTRTMPQVIILFISMTHSNPTLLKYFYL